MYIIASVINGEKNGHKEFNKLLKGTVTEWLLMGECWVYVKWMNLRVCSGPALFEMCHDISFVVNWRHKTDMTCLKKHTYTYHNSTHTHTYIFHILFIIISLLIFLFFFGKWCAMVSEIIGQTALKKVNKTKLKIQYDYKLPKMKCVAGKNDCFHFPWLNPLYPGFLFCAD